VAFGGHCRNISRIYDKQYKRNAHLRALQQASPTSELSTKSPCRNAHNRAHHFIARDFVASSAHATGSLCRSSARIRSGMSIYLLLLSEWEIHTEFTQCGGKGYSGVTRCDSGFACTPLSDAVSICLPAAVSSMTRLPDPVPTSTRN